MATIEIAALAQHLSDDEITGIEQSLAEAGAPPLDLHESAEGELLEGQLDDDIFIDFLDRLDASGGSADIYLPMDFDDVIDVGDRRVGSAHALMLVLESLREDFLVEDDDSNEDEDLDSEDYDSLEDGDDESSRFSVDEDSAIELKDALLRHVWSEMNQGAKACVRQGLCMFIHK